MKIEFELIVSARGADKPGLDRLSGCPASSREIGLPTMIYFNSHCFFIICELYRSNRGNTATDPAPTVSKSNAPSHTTMALGFTIFVAYAMAGDMNSDAEAYARSIFMTSL